MGAFFSKGRLYIFFITLRVTLSVGLLCFPLSAFSQDPGRNRQIKRGASVARQQASGDRYIKAAREPKRPPNRSIEYENLIDQIDVYALSPHARKIALPRMVSQAVFREKKAARLPIDWVTIISEASVKHNLDPALIAAVIKVESGFSVNAVSPKGAKGLMQVMPRTASELGVVDICNPSENVDAGSRYLRRQLDRFGRLELALAAYNAGPGAVTKYGGIPPYKETQQFVKKVLSEI